jgi:NAD-dependent histone deacetylase SIR2
MVLSSEENSNSDAIGKAAERDLRTGLDMVIVVGTGLKVPGLRRLVEESCRSVRAGDG